MNSTTRLALVSFLVLAMLMVTTGTRSTAWASEPVLSFGRVIEKNVSAGTILVYDRVYHIDARTKIWDVRGHRIELEALPTVIDLDAGQQQPGAVKIEAVERNGRWEVTRIQAVRATPE